MVFLDHLSIYSLPAFITFIINLFLGFYVFIKKPSNPVNCIFLGMVVSISSWNFADFMMMNALTENSAIWGAKFIKGCLFLPLFFFMFTNYFLQKSRNKDNFDIIHILILIPGFLSLAYMNYFYNTILDVKYLNIYKIYFYHFKMDNRFLPYLVMITYGVIYSLFGLINLFRAHKNFKREREKLQIRYFIYASFIFSTATFLMDYSLFSSRTWGLYLSLFFRLAISIFFAVAILKLKLIETKSLISKTFFYSFSYAVVLGIYVFLIKATSEYFAKKMHIQSVFFDAFIIFVLVFLFQPLKTKIYNFISKYIYQSAYKRNRILSDFSGSFGDYVDIDNLLDATYNKFEILFDINGIAVFLFNKLNNEYRLRYLKGKFYEITINKESKIISFLKEYSEPLETAYLETTYNAVYKKLKNIKAELIIPLIKKDHLIGFIVLPEKNSEKKYSIDEIESLRTFSNQIAMAIDHIFLVETMEFKTKKLMQTEKMAALYELSAGISHEIRNPLNIMQGAVDILKDNEEDQETKEEMISFLSDEIKRLNKLITDFLKFSKLKGLKLSFNNIIPVLEQLVSMFELKASSKHIKMNLIIETKDSFFYFDKQLLNQVFMNIVINAFDAMDKKGVFEIKLRSFYDNTQKKIAIHFKDNGKGMNKETKDKIFNPFFTTKESGTGLGLSISLNILKEHNANIDIVSKIRRGTEFILTFNGE